MDYKEKYEQAIFRMNKWVEGSEITDPKEVAEYVFPELKESNDESIRKECISIIDAWDKLCRSQGDCCEVAPKCLAWLEKQGEHANFRNKIQIGDEVTRNEDGVLVNLSQFKRMVKQNEQKPTWSEEDEKMFNSIIEVLEVTPSARFVPIKREIMIPWLKSLKERMKGE